MTVLHAFLATWSNARQTFGEGTPQPGAQYDNSAALRQAQSTVESAAPGSRWTGGAANAYGAANTEHGRVIGQLAALDQRLSAHVDQSAEVVAAGRRDLDSVRRWVVDAAASTPQGQAGEQMRLTIVQKGIGRVQEIIQRSNGELNFIGGKIRGLGDEYQALGNQKFGSPKEGPEFVGGEKDEQDAEAKRRQAEKDVHDALAGDKEAAKRVESALNQIKPGQQLTPEQGSYLSQMQAQQNGMSIAALKTAEQRLGDQTHIIGDSWQLMSNDDVYFPKTQTKIGALDDPNTMAKGGFDQLPRSVQSTLNQPDIVSAKDVQDISHIVKDGNPEFQTNTDLDRGMLKKSAVMMDTRFWQQSAEEYNIPPDQRLKWLDPVVSDAFSAVSPDHQAIHDAITTGPGHIDGIDSDKFMHGLTHRIWADGGDGAGDLFEWTKNAGGPEAGMASETAEAYGKYLGQHGGELLDLPGHHGIGEINPRLVQAFGQGLAPYQGAMVGDPTNNHGFDPLDGLGSDMPNTRNLFAVIDSDPTAAKQFNGEAYLRAAGYESNFAQAAATDPVVDGTDAHHDDLRKAGRLLGLVDAGADIETRSHNTNQQQSAYEHAKASWELRNTAYQSIMNNIPGGDRVAAALQDGLIGKEPQESDFPPGPYTTDVGPHADQRALGNATTQAQYVIAAGMVHGPNVDIPSNYFKEGVLMTPAEVRAQYGEFGWEDYSSKLQAYIAKYPSLSAASTEFQFTFGTIAGIGPVEPPK